MVLFFVVEGIKQLVTTSAVFEEMESECQDYNFIIIPVGLCST